VNISPLELNDPNFISRFDRLRDAFGIDISCIEVELTESALIDSPSMHVDDIISGLDKRGISLTIDDFGTGHSSLHRLAHLPFSKIKIDKSFVWGIGSGKQVECVIETIIQLARKLDRVVVAEGVETEQQLRFLTECDCDLIQGFFLARPMPPAKLFSFISSQSKTALLQSATGSGMSARV
jgi:EAL domain-containing protein (putative c-di-GMP-specific phosphodiesterase class I)